MLLYHCPVCGRWQVSIAKALSDVVISVARAFNQPEPPQLGCPCPADHGQMEPVLTTDRIFVRPSEVEALPEIEEPK